MSTIGANQPKPRKVGGISLDQYWPELKNPTYEVQIITLFGSLWEGSARANWPARMP